MKVIYLEKSGISGDDQQKVTQIFQEFSLLAFRSTSDVTYFYAIALGRSLVFSRISMTNLVTSVWYLQRLCFVLE